MAESPAPLSGAVPPIRLDVTVRRDVDDAFARFTGAMTAWWPLDRFSFSRERAQQVLMEPWVGGRFYERYRDGEEFVIGEVLVWEPPNRVVFTWRGLDWVAPTEITVRFTRQEPSVTRVQVEHAGWERLGSLGLERRNQYADGWPAVIAAYTS